MSEVVTVRDPEEEATARLSQLDTLLQTIGLDAQTVLARHDRGTIAPRHDTPRTTDQAAIAALSPLSLADATSDTQDFALGRTLGEGGMGVVRVAEQRSLEREVAVKSLKEGGKSDKAALALLREAWVMGRLEHPNIVPIHALGRDDAGQPVFVMKRIEGQAWDELLADPARLPEGARTDPLRWHLGVLLQVCNAMAFAHSRGVLHRDLKPANVMVGPFGEVYVLDWGLAVSLRDDERRLPRARDVNDIAGTLHYMAPEMVAGQGEQFDERTDVYLLGAILHEILTNEPRHSGRTPMEILAAAFQSRTVAYGDDVPAELADIANRATSFNRHDRFADVAGLQAAVATFLEHSASLAVAAAATQRLQELREAIARHDPTQERTLDLDVPDPIAERFAACRFGFQAALDSWPENPSAREGLRDALELMAQHELDQGHLRAARALLAALEDPAAHLLQQADALASGLKAEREHKARLERMQKELDRGIGTRTRAFLALILGVLFAAVPPGVLGWLKARGTEVDGHLINFATSGVFLLAVVVGWVWARETMTKTAFNRRVLWSLLSLAVASVLLSGAVHYLDLDPKVGPVMSMLSCGLYMALLSSMLDPRLWFSTVAYAVAFFGTMLTPEWTICWVSGGHAASTLYVAWTWRPSRIRGSYEGDARKLDLG